MIERGVCIRRGRLGALAVIALALVSAPQVGRAAPDNAEPQRLRALEELRVEKAGTAAAGLREREQRDEALRAGACEGARWETARLNRRFEQESAKLDRIFNFAPLVIAGNVMPPVITEVRNASSRTGPSALHTAWVVYRIRKDAAVVTAPPNWRRYLWREPGDCAPPPRALLPKKEERANWKAAVDEGWQEGVKAADAVGRERLRRLVRDMLGMIRFRQLAASGLVGLPVVAGSPPRVVVEGRELRVGERVFRITQEAGFRAPGGWKPVVRDRWIGGLGDGDSGK